MSSAWATPTIISQFSEDGAEEFHVSWDDSDNFSQLKNFDQRSLNTVGALQHIARSPKHDIKNKTYYIRAKGFNFESLPSVLSGIEVRLNARRYGRVVDDTIQLLVNDVVSGNNKADLIIKPEKIYGGEVDLWGVENLSLADIQNSDFGIVLRFQCHPNWPHKDPILLDSVEIRIH